MKTLMRYQITSGRVVEKRDVLIDVSLDPTTGRRQPRGKRRGASAADQIERNCNEAVLRLARTLNATYQAGDLFLTLKYDDGRLPETREEAEHQAKLFLQRVGRAYRRATGKKLRWVLVTADRSAKTGAPVRLHHHLVIPATAWEVVARNWPTDQLSARMLDGTGDYTAVARYMVRNAGYQRGKRTWSTSQGMEKPTFSRPVPVKEVGSFQVPKGAFVAERNVRESRESGFSAAYIRYVLPARGGASGKPRPTGSRHEPSEAGHVGGGGVTQRSGCPAGRRAEGSEVCDDDVAEGAERDREKRGGRGDGLPRRCAPRNDAAAGRGTGDREGRPYGDGMRGASRTPPPTEGTGDFGNRGPFSDTTRRGRTGAGASSDCNSGKGGGQRGGKV